jgi:type I restriction enzyme S subunit
LEDFNKRFPDDMQKSILQMAIQGKLVEQRPEEGTAEDLYKQIQSEKQSLIKAGKIKKEKPLPPISDDEIPFEIPENWKWVRFLSVIDIATNLVQPFEYKDYFHIAPDNIEKGTGKLLSYRTVFEDKVASPNHLFKKGQIIYSKIRPLLRKAVIAPFDGLCSADMYPLDTKIDVSYLLHYLLSDTFNHQIINAMSSRVKMPKINQNELTKICIPLPPLAEQKRIVAKIEELLPLCERLK